MTYQEAITFTEQILPTALGLVLVLFALSGIQELLKETSTALEKKVSLN